MGVLVQLLEHGETVVSRQAKVQQDDVDLAAPRQCQAVAPVPRAEQLNVVLDQADGQRFMQIRVVVNQQNLG